MLTPTYRRPSAARRPTGAVAAKQRPHDRLCQRRQLWRDRARGAGGRRHRCRRPLDGARAAGLGVIWVDGEGRNQIAVASGVNMALEAGALARHAAGRRHHSSCCRWRFPPPRSKRPSGMPASRRQDHPQPGTGALPSLPRRCCTSDIPSSSTSMRRPRCARWPRSCLCRGTSPAVAGTRSGKYRDCDARCGGCGRCAWGRDLSRRGLSRDRHRYDGRRQLLRLRAGRGPPRGGATLPEAMRRAAVAGSLACTIVGAMPSFRTRHQIDAALARAGRR